MRCLCMTEKEISVETYLLKFMSVLYMLKPILVIRFSILGRYFQVFNVFHLIDIRADIFQD